MNLTLSLNANTRVFTFDWQPLFSNGSPCYLWAYPKKKKGDDLPTIYRHVLDVPECGTVTVYVGEGGSLCGPRKANLAHQYGSGGHGQSRKKVIDYVHSRTERGWSEILLLPDRILDLHDERLRKFLQATLIAAYYWEHRELLAKTQDLPDFLNDPT